MSKNKKIFFYTAYIAAVTCILLYYLFPSDMIKETLAHKVSQANPDFSVITGQASPVLPPGLKLQDVTVKRFDQAIVDISEIRIKPVLLSFFKPETIYTFTGMTGDGVFDGTAVISKKKSGDRLRLNINLSEIQILEIPGLQDFSRYRTAGLLSGRIDFDKSRRPIVNAHADLNLADTVLTFPAPVFGLDNLAFQYVEGEITLKGRRMQIKKCTFNGTQLDGTVTGTIILKNPFEKSTLRLTGSILPHSNFMAGTGQGIAGMLLPKIKSAKKGLAFKIRGTLEDPRFSL
ncbi:MAG: type II secretion system protein GspN [Deltaproteobacteria bacterium]|nr:MAG: type II secretion system protein GspN [Deltaproteobacteria bacterium]